MLSVLMWQLTRHNGILRPRQLRQHSGFARLEAYIHDIHIIVKTYAASNVFRYPIQNTRWRQTMLCFRQAQKNRGVLNDTKLCLPMHITLDCSQEICASHSM